MSTFRVGGKVPLNVYEDDRPVFQAHTPEDAARLVELLNAGLAAQSPNRVHQLVEENARLRAALKALLEACDGNPGAIATADAVVADRAALQSAGKSAAGREVD